MSQNAQQNPKEEDRTIKMVLVVEDDTDIGTFLIQAIQQETIHQAMLVRDGFQALRAVSNLQPGLFILDYQLPRMNGIELYDHLHVIPGMEQVPAIILSARLPRHEIEKRKIFGINKPLELDDLLQTIEHLLG